MIDVKESVTHYSNELTEKVLEHAGGADITSYLGHIFSTRNIHVAVAYVRGRIPADDHM